MMIDKCGPMPFIFRDNVKIDWDKLSKIKVEIPTTWEEVIAQCKSNPGHHFPCGRLTLSYSEGTFCIDIPWESIEKSHEDILDYLKRNYGNPFS